MLGRKTRPAPPFHIFGQLPHGLLRDLDAFAPIDGSLCRIDGREDFRAATLALDPQAEGLLHRVFGTFKPTALDGAADKVLLLERKSYSHTIKRSIAG